MLLHPMIIFVVCIAIVTFTAGFTDRGSPLRYVALLLLAGCTYLMPQALSSFSDARGWVGRLLSGAAFWNCITLSDRLIIRGWDYHNYGPHTLDHDKKHDIKRADTRPSDVAKTRIDFGSEICSESRGVGRFWEVKNVPPFSRTDPRFVPSRGSFIANHAIAVVVSYFVHNWAIATMASLDRDLLSAEHVPFLSRLSYVTYDELLTRTVATFAYWTAQYCMMQFFFSAAAVMTGISKPEDIKLLRPLFGSPRDAYSVRNAWGKSWHQMLRSGLEGTSGFVAHDVLRLPRNGLVQRYTKIFGSFVLSGVMHTIADMGGGVTMMQSGSLQFYCMQAVGIVFEDAVQAVYKRITSRPATPSEKLVYSLVGYSWVVFFFIWTSPTWVYPVLLEMREEDMMMGFTGFKAILFGR